MNCAIITCIFFLYYADAGDIQLFNSLQPGLTQGLPQETVEWKRSYGRPPRAVTLSATFEPFREGSGKTFNRLSACQVLHIYFLECQVSHKIQF